MKKEKKVKKGGNYSTFYGPFDPVNHNIYALSDNEQKKHINDMINKRDKSQQEHQENINEFNKKQEELIQKKLKDIDTFNFNKKLNQQKYEFNLKGLFTFFAWIISKIGEFGKWLFKIFGKFGNYITELIKSIGDFSWQELWKGILKTFKYIISCFGYIIELFTDSKASEKIIIFICGLILIAIVVILILLLFTNVFGISIPSLSCNFPNTYNFNIFGPDLYNNNKSLINNYKPSYDSIPRFNLTFKDFISNPFVFLSTFFIYMGHSINYILFPADIVRHLSYISAKSTINIKNALGYIDNTSLYKTDREIFNEGRSDNIFNIDTSLISDKNLLREKQIPDSGSVLTIGYPKDIIWNFSQEDYFNTEYNKLPESLLDYKNSSNSLSLNEKKQIIIPWISNGEYYKLSCSDAIFKNNEKANILIDNDDNTCSINTNNDAIKYKEPKKRYIKTDDISNFVP